METVVMREPGITSSSVADLSAARSSGRHATASSLATESLPSRRPSMCVSAEGDAFVAAKSLVTQAFRSNKVEWWVLRHNSDPKDLTAESSSGIEDDGVKGSEILTDSWCGCDPLADISQERDSLKAKTSQPLKLDLGGVFAPLRRYTSRQRNRYTDDGFDLDLSYVTTRIIAMGLPGTGMDAAFRNPQSEVSRFLNTKHQNHFRIYNLCAEEKHTANGFPDETVHIPCVDHQPPSFRVMLDFCRDAGEWLQKDEENTIVVHCKAGKGRTGTMICALLVYAGACSSAYHALVWYEMMRGGKRAGVTIPAQIRWVAMFERWLKLGVEGLKSDPLEPPILPYRLRRVQLHNLGMEGPVFIQVGLLSRDAVYNKSKPLWLPEQEGEVDELSRSVLVELPGTLWDAPDGQMRVRIRCNGNDAKPTKPLEVNVWWQHAFLRELPAVDDEGSLMMLEVAKPWVHGLEKDIGHDKLVPAGFFLRATFQEEIACMALSPVSGTASGSISLKTFRRPKEINVDATQNDQDESTNKVSPSGRRRSSNHHLLSGAVRHTKKILATASATQLCKGFLGNMHMRMMSTPEATQWGKGKGNAKFTDVAA